MRPWDHTFPAAMMDDYGGGVIDVAFTRAELRPADIAVVIDVLRATSTATQALAAGYQRVLCADTIERARTLRAPGRVLAGERHGLKPEGFDQGNSPAEAAQARGAELVLATTNGAPTIVAAAAHAPEVLLCSLLNLDPVIAAIRDRVAGRDATVQVVCSGTDGGVALEDVYVAGRVSQALAGERTDAALVAEGVARAFETPEAALGASADARALRNNGMATDIAYCALVSRLDSVPVVAAVQGGVATVVDDVSGAGVARRARAGSSVAPLEHGDTVEV
jgi:2-phosphosulfolactate phosphatase